MVSISVPEIHSWGNLYYPSLSGALRLPLRHAEGLRALFLFGRGVAGMMSQSHMVGRYKTRLFG